MVQRDGTNRAIDRRHRGASLVEYALAIVGLFLVLLGGAKLLEAAAGNEVRNEPDCVSTRPPPPPVTDGSGHLVSGCQVRSVTTSTAVSGPTTTAPPPPPPASGAMTWESPATTGSVTTAWAVDVTVRVTTGSPPVGAPGTFVRVRVDMTPTGGPFFLSCTTGSDGRCPLHFDIPSPAIPSVTFTVVQIDPADATFTVDSVATPLSVAAPP